MIVYLLAGLVAALWGSGIALVVFAVLGAMLDRDCLRTGVRSPEGIRHSSGKP